MSITPVDYIFKSDLLLVECRDNVFKTTFAAMQLKPFVLMKTGLLLLIKSNFYYVQFYSLHTAYYLLIQIKLKQIYLFEVEHTILVNSRQRNKFLVLVNFIYISCCYVKVGLSPSKKLALFASMKALKNYEKRFRFHLKNSFRSQDIEIFVLTVWSFMKNDLIWNIRLIS